jgi:hypothetical protein
MKNKNQIRRAQSCASEAREAVREFHAGVNQPAMALVIFFCSSKYDLDVLAAEMKHAFAGVQVVGCTTCGEIGPAGYKTHSLTGASFSAHDFSIVSGQIDCLQQFEISAGQDFAKKLLQRFKSQAPQANADNSFALLLIDGMSIREEPVTRAFQSALGKIPLIGASAADDIELRTTYVYSDGRFSSDSAVLILANTRLPFKVFKTQHFVSTDQKMVVTEADTANRLVKEINGLPAAQEYARLLNIKSDGLDPMRFAASPVVVVIDGANYVRSIQQANPDGSLRFGSAIEEGLVLRMAKGVDLLKNLEQTFAGLHADIGPFQIALSFDCGLRKMEIAQLGIEDRVGKVFAQNNAIGVNTYGEQFHGLHINQTLVGVAIGEDSREPENV